MNEESENAWLAGKDVLSAAMVRDVPPGEMETVYDQLLEKSQLNTR
jgi:hypothetical protein